MGAGRWDADDWAKYAKTNSHDTKSRDELLSSRNLHSDLDPKNVIRESRDSDINPKSTPIIIGMDVSGSMGMVSEVMVRKGLNKTITELYARKPVTDPHILLAAIGDAEAGDSAPLQVTQFEADLRLAEQTEKIWIYGGGGGNSYESYLLVPYFAATQTATDSFSKRGKKGYIFTIGDEGPTPYLRSRDLERVTGKGLPNGGNISSDEVLTLSSREWDYFHIIVEEGSHARSHPEVLLLWQKVLGQRVILLSDHTKLAEVIVSAIQIAEGETHDAVSSSWDGSTSLVVRSATKSLTKSAEAVSGLVSL